MIKILSLGGNRNETIDSFIVSRYVGDDRIERLFFAQKGR